MIVLRLHPLFYLELIFLLSGCAGTYQLFPSYDLPHQVSPLVPLGKTLILSLVLSGTNETLWYQRDNDTWMLGKEPQTLVREAVTKEFKMMGIELISEGKTGSDYDRLEVRIRWLAPYGHDFRSAVVILSCALFEKGKNYPFWSGKLEGFSEAKLPYFLIKTAPSFLEKTIVAALKNALRQFYWKPGFKEAIARLAFCPPLPTDRSAGHLPQHPKSRSTEIP